MKTIAIISALAAIAGVAQAMPMPAPSGIPNGNTAKEQLAGLSVRSGPDAPGYKRDLFPHWNMQYDECNTREVILQRDGKEVEIDDKCRALSGSWTCPFEGKTYTQASDIDIDHMVPLKNAWISGASNWTTAQRTEFANDLKNPQLWATRDIINQQKSDSSPDKWKPPLTSFYCTYASAWTAVKHAWKLSITQPEKDALTEMLNTCTTAEVEFPVPFFCKNKKL